MKRLTELQIKFPRADLHLHRRLARLGVSSRAREPSRCFGYENLILEVAVDRQVKAGHVKRG